MNRKEIYEQHVTRCMLDVLGIAYTNVRSGKADIGEPDCVITTPTGLLGVEVTTASPSEEIAKAEWQPQKYTMTDAMGNRHYPAIDEPDQKLAAEVLRVIQKHLKSYTGVQQCILLVPMDAWMTEDDVLDQLLLSLRSTLGDAKPFSAIYLGAYRGEEGIFVPWSVFPALV